MSQVNTSLSKFSDTPLCSERKGKGKLGIETEKSVKCRCHLIIVFLKLLKVIYD